MAKVRNVQTAACLLLLFAFQQRSDPVVVTITEPEQSEFASLANVLLGSLGLTGVLVLASILAACVFGGILFWLRSRAA
jgi:hypothetical protein